MMKKSIKTLNRYQPLKIPNPMLRLVASPAARATAAAATRAAHATATEMIEQMYGKRTEQEYVRSQHCRRSNVMDLMPWRIDIEKKKKILSNIRECITSLEDLGKYVRENDELRRAFANIYKSKEYKRCVNAFNGDPTLITFANEKGRYGEKIVVDVTYETHVQIKIRNVKTGKTTDLRDLRLDI